MTYPASDPVCKHDLLCPSSVIDAVHGGGGGGGGGNGSSAAAPLASVDALSSSIVQSAVPVPQLPPDVKRLATVYTYRDAPTRPKPLSRAPRVWRLVARGTFDAATNDGAGGGDVFDGNGGSVLKACDVAVKLPSRIPPGDGKSQNNAKAFRKFVRFLRERKLAAVLACDSAGRIGFVVPGAEETGGGWDESGNGSEGRDHAARLCYAPMKEFLPWAKENAARHAAQKTARRGDPALDADGEEPATWTPPYTPPPEEECRPRGWGDDSREGGEPETWTPQYDPPPEEECGPRGWEDHERSKPKPDDDDDAPKLFVPPGASTNDDDGATGLFVPPGAGDGGGFGNGDEDGFGTAGLFVPPSSGDNGGWDASDAWGTNGDGFGDNPNSDAATADNDTGLGAWTAAAPAEDAAGKMEGGTFHADKGAAAADAFYSGLTRSLGTRADSHLFHMRNFNGWVKATQIAELDPDTSRAATGVKGGKKRSRTSPLRVLDLACGKGGDLGKWSIHPRKLENYVGVDVARGSLVDAAKRARDMGRRGMRRCTFTLADLGEDVPGRRRSKRARRMQKLLTWNLQSETSGDKRNDPAFVAEEGGGISETDKFDVVSIQFAIHYMMSSRKRARRFFRTVASLLEVGGNLVATTIDARVVVEELMGLGLDLHFDDTDLHEDVDKPGEEARHQNGNARRRARDDRPDGAPAATVSVGNGACRLKFDADALRRVFRPSSGDPDDAFGLEYTFTLVEGSDHAAGVGEAVDLPEWLTPVPVLEGLAGECGLELEYATNFHEFYEERRNPARHPMAHNALYSMKVLDRNGSISGQEWEVSRMYAAVKFRKVREVAMDLGDEEVTEEEMRE